MPRTFRAILTIGVALVCATAQAEVYKSIDKEGNVTFTDQPGTGAEPVDMRGTNSIPAVAPAKAEESVDVAVKDPKESITYKSVRIVKPKDDSGIGHGPGDFSVKARTTPKLHEEHRLQLFMDGSARGKANRSGSFALSNVDRGTHKLTVKVVDADGNVKKASKPVTVHVFRPSVTMPAY